MNALKNPQMARLHHKWQNNPEPMASPQDGTTILDTDEASYDAYFWSAHNCQEGWLAYDGALAVVQD
jgi:hypothetical protein